MKIRKIKQGKAFWAMFKIAVALLTTAVAFSIKAVGQPSLSQVTSEYLAGAVYMTSFQGEIKKGETAMGRFTLTQGTFKVSLLLFDGDELISKEEHIVMNNMKGYKPTSYNITNTVTRKATYFIILTYLKNETIRKTN